MTCLKYQKNKHFSVGLMTRRMRHLLLSDSSLAPSLHADRVFNSEGIFKWVSEDRNLVNRKSESTSFVHPFSLMWGLIGLSTSRWKWDPVDWFQGLKYFKYYLMIRIISQVHKNITLPGDVTGFFTSKIFANSYFYQKISSNRGQH
jgi:hypothetical protein